MTLRITLAALFVISACWPARLPLDWRPNVARAQVAPAADQDQLVLYRNSFESQVGQEWSHALRDTTPCGRNFLGQFTNEAVRLALAGLPSHSDVTLSFDLYIIRTWDGNNSTSPPEAPYGPDVWDLSIEGGPTLLHTTFTNGGSQAYPGTYPGSQFPGQTGAAEVNTLGYTVTFPGQPTPWDSVYRLSFAFGHSANSLAFIFAGIGLQDVNDESWGIDNLRVTATATQTPAAADLDVSTTASADPVATGARLSFITTVANKGPATATDVIVDQITPPGTTFAFVSASQGACSNPPSGQTCSQSSCSLGAIAPGESATVTFTVNVIAPGGSNISHAATVSASSTDPRQGNNSSSRTVKVQGGGIVQLSWEQTAPTPEDPAPPPRNLQVKAGVTSPAPETREDGYFPAEQGPCMLVKVNVYKSDQPGVQAIPANLWKSVPPEQAQTAMAAAPAGSFYVITNVWNCNGQLIESGLSNEEGVPSGPALTKASVGSKIKVTGSGYSSTVELFLDGAGFSKQAKISGSKVTQKGQLVSGEKISEIATLGKRVVMTVRNNNGGVGSLSYTK